MLTYSLSELVDKLSVVHLKLWHIEDEIGKRKKEDYPAEEIEPLCNQIVTLNALRIKIVNSIDEMFEGMKKNND